MSGVADVWPAKGATLLTVRDVRKSFGGVEVLHSTNCVICGGELTLIHGPSGSGKTTLLHMLAGIVVPTSGTITHDPSGLVISSLPSTRRAAWRSINGHVFQEPGLLANLTVLENMRLDSSLTGALVDAERAARLCAQVQVDHLLDARAATLSAGEAQRVALVRAMLGRPSLLFADEPTASLDSESTEAVHDVLRQSVNEDGTSVVVVSHDAAAVADRALAIADGVVLAGEDVAAVGSEGSLCR